MSKIQSKSKKQVELEEDSSSEEEIVTKKQVKTAQPAAKKAPAKKVVESEESSDEEEIIKPAPKGKAAAKADTKTATKAKKVESDSEESELEDIAPKGKKAAAAPVKKAAAKKAESSDEESEEETPKAKAKPAAKKAVAKKAESSDEESEEEVKPVAKKAPVQAKKPAKAESSDEESEEEVKPAAKKAPAKKPVKEESEEEESEEEVKPAAKTQAAPAQNGPADDGNYEVFIKGLPFAAAEHDIREYFQEAGEIASVNLLKGPDGRSKGIAFVRYVDNNGLTTALTYSNGDFGGRQILVEKTTPKGQRNDGAQGGRGGFGGAARGGFGGAAGNPAEFGPKSERDPNSCSIFVGNLSWGTDEHSLSAFFESCGAVQNVRIARDPEGKARGFGHVDFAAPDAVEQAVAKAGQNLDGRPVRVDYATSKKQDGGRGGFGGGARGGAPGGQRMNLGFEDAAKKKGSISSFQGQKQRL